MVDNGVVVVEEEESLVLLSLMETKRRVVVGRRDTAATMGVRCATHAVPSGSSSDSCINKKEHTFQDKRVCASIFA